MASSLTGNGWWSGDLLLESGLSAALFSEAAMLSLAGQLVPATTGRSEGRLMGSVRGDSTLWLDDPACGPAAARFLVALDGLRIELNRGLMLGLHDVEAQFAVYPPGTGYTRHRDRFRDDDARVVSLVCYLNTDWPAEAGGALRLHLDGGDHDIAPRSGTTVLFMSADIEHEVMPSTCTRTSIAAWFRRNPV